MYLLACTHAHRCSANSSSRRSATRSRRAAGKQAGSHACWESAEVGTAGYGGRRLRAVMRLEPITRFSRAELEDLCARTPACYGHAHTRTHTPPHPHPHRHGDYLYVYIYVYM